MNYDFIEIGTSDFDTLIQTATNDTVGLSIDPIQFYLNRLPEKQLVKKVNCAVSFDGKRGKDKVYYIPLHIIYEHQFPLWIRGCNAVGDYHYQHKKHNLEKLVKTIDIDCIPLSEIFEENDVDKVTVLKIDTEGGDCKILQSFIPFLLLRDKDRWPVWIEFETNILTPKEIVDETIDLYIDLGYKVARRGVGEQNTILTIDI